MSKGIIYYTANKIEDPICSIAKKFIDVGLPISSASLKPMNFGKNVVLNRDPSYLTMATQIVAALENLDTDSFLHPLEIIFIITTSMFGDGIILTTGQ